MQPNDPQQTPQQPVVQPNPVPVESPQPITNTETVASVAQPAPQVQPQPAVAAPAPLAAPEAQPAQPIAPSPVDSQTVAAVPTEQEATPQAAPSTDISSQSVETTAQPYSQQLPEIVPLAWQSNEYAQHDKTPVWYIVLAVVVIVLMGVSMWFGAWSFAILIPVMVVALMVYTHRPPQMINYAVSEKGLFINDTLHPMGEFREFSVGEEMQQNLLVLIPVKRFRPAIKVFFPAEVGEQLVDTVGAYLPSQDYRVDFFDRIIQKLRI